MQCCSEFEVWERHGQGDATVCWLVTVMLFLVCNSHLGKGRKLCVKLVKSSTPALPRKLNMIYASCWITLYPSSKDRWGSSALNLQRFQKHNLRSPAGKGCVLDPWKTCVWDPVSRCRFCSGAVSVRACSAIWMTCIRNEALFTFVHLSVIGAWADK